MANERVSIFRLCQESDQLRLVSGGFTSYQTYPIGSIGEAGIDGEDELEGYPDVGIAIVDNRIHLDRPQSLVNQGFYGSNIIVHANLDLDPDINFVLGKMRHPGTDLVLLNQIDLVQYGKQDITGFSNVWTMPNSALPLGFFVKRDPVLLSRLEFSFATRR